jgi:hypothetical protein
MYWRGLNAFSTQQYEHMALRSRHSLKIADFIYYKRDFREEIYRSPIARLGDVTLYAKVHSMAQEAVRKAVQNIMGEKEQEMKSMTHILFKNSQSLDILEFGSVSFLMS